MWRLLAVVSVALVLFGWLVFGLASASPDMPRPAVVGMLQVAMMTVMVEAMRPTRPPAI